MKNLLWTVLLLLLMPAVSLAGPFSRARDGQAQAMVMQKVQEWLELSEDQKSKVEPIIGKAISEFKGLKELPTQERRTRAFQLMTTTLGEVRPILTPVQRQKVVDLLEQARQSIK